MSRLPAETTDDLHHYYHINLPQPYHPQLYDLPHRGTSSPTPMTAYTDHWQPRQYQRNRPKFTRNKMGCLTCRKKKVKCDEEKPDCARCRVGSRECVWPDHTTSQKRGARREAKPAYSPSIDARPSTAGSSGLSEASALPAQRFIVAKSEPVELSLPPASSNGLTARNPARPGSVISRAPPNDQSNIVSSSQYRSHDELPDVQDLSGLQHYQPNECVSPIPPPQYFAYHHDQQFHHQAIHAKHWRQHTSYSTAQTSRQQYHETNSLPLKTGYNNQERQALVAQRVDPLNPFAYPSMHNYYPLPHDNPSVAHEPRSIELFYPYAEQP